MAFGNGAPGESLPTGRLEVLAELREMESLMRWAQARKFALTAQIADEYGFIDDAEWGPLVPGTERLVPAGSDGTPEIAEFAALEIAAALHTRVETVEMELANAVDCRHRMPHAWAATMSGRLTVWQARNLAADCVELDYAAARAVDEKLRHGFGTMPWRRLENWAKGLVLEHLPADKAEERRSAERASVGVWFTEGEGLVGSVTAVLDRPDLKDLEARVAEVTRILRSAGLTGSDDELRAKALAVLANPAHALQLLQASLLDPALAVGSILPFDERSAPCELSGRLGHTCGTITTDPEKLLPRARVVVHLTDEVLQQGSGIARIEGIGPALTGWLGEILGHRRITVRPVLDANATTPADCYEVPDRMREAIELRNPHEAFPWSTRRSRRCDLDHTEPFEPGGLPGQTRPDNLGPLSRKVHRAKTHGRWRVHQVAPGCFVWRSPLGFVHLVTPTISLELFDPTQGTWPTAA